MGAFPPPLPPGSSPHSPGFGPSPQPLHPGTPPPTIPPRSVSSPLPPGGLGGSRVNPNPLPPRSYSPPYVPPPSTGGSIFGGTSINFLSIGRWGGGILCIFLSLILFFVFWPVGLALLLLGAGIIFVPMVINRNRGTGESEDFLYDSSERTQKTIYEKMGLQSNNKMENFKEYNDVDERNLDSDDIFLSKASEAPMKKRKSKNDDIKISTINVNDKEKK